MTDLFDRPEAIQAAQVFDTGVKHEISVMLLTMPEPLKDALMDLVRNSYVRGWVDSIDNREYH